MKVSACGVDSPVGSVRTLPMNASSSPYVMLFFCTRPSPAIANSVKGPSAALGGCLGPSPPAWCRPRLCPMACASVCALLMPPSYMVTPAFQAVMSRRTLKPGAARLGGVVPKYE